MVSLFRILFCAVWSIFWISSSLIIYLFTFQNKIPVAMARSCWAPGILWCFGLKVSAIGTESLDKRQPYVFVSNHQSFLDIPILFRTIPNNLYFVAKKELKWIPFLGWYMMATGMIFIDRSDRKKAIQSLKRTGKLIKRGRSVLMFPEGTRSKDKSIAPFKKGPFVMAREAEVSVIPLGIREEGEMVAWGKWGKTKITVHVGAPIKFKDDMPDFIAQAREQVAELANKPISALS
ncbi:MAG: 1-acyl-sn-glycerol-3-phosphate acyltransferase [Cyclobacteriaceae bacterium]